MTNSASTSNLQAKVWGKELYKDVMANLFFMKKNMMGDGDNNIVQVKSDLIKSVGDTYWLPLTSKLSGNGITGDSELEGNEESITPYSESVVIDQIRNAVRLTGKLDEKKNSYDMRSDAKNKLRDWLVEFIERQIFLKMCSVNNTSLTDINGTVVGTRSTWSNTPDEVSDTITNLGYGNRYLCADYTAGATSLASTDLLTPALISRLKVKAINASPKIQPLQVNGKNYYVVFVHPWAAFDLKNNAVWSQAQREAGIRGDENPIFSGALGIWDGCIIHEHEYMGYLDISIAGNNFGSADSGTDYAAVDTFRTVLCGKQAICFAKASSTEEWVEESFDYKNKVGFATGMIGGIQKVQFNSKDYGICTLDTAATAHA